MVKYILGFLGLSKYYQSYALNKSLNYIRLLQFMGHWKLQQQGQDLALNFWFNSFKR